jgi:predicted glycoside hydrolase/deacetylase ChbG (UPF0249 family)
MKLPKTVVIVADDFGYCECRSVGIAKCSSWLSAASVLVTHPRSVVVPACSLGLHLNLTEGAPISKNVPSLVDGATGHMRGKMGLRSAVLVPEEVRKEILAQFAEFEVRYGRLPRHVDGHNHAHLVPVVAQELARVIGRIQMENDIVIWTRIPAQVVSREKHPWVSDASLAFFQRVFEECQIARPIYEAHNVQFCRGFVGLSTQGEMGTTERVLEALQETEQEVVEWMVHPGNACSLSKEHLWGDDFSVSLDREMEMLLVETVGIQLAKSGVQIMRP